MSLATKGVAVKLPLSFLEPCADRGGWLQTNAPSACVFLRRAKYTRVNKLKMGEFGCVSYTQDISCDTTTRLVFCCEWHGCDFEHRIVGCASLACEIVWFEWGNKQGETFLPNFLKREHWSGDASNRAMWGMGHNRIV
ncbi:unnamed protein product [Ectocarpus sp. 12 AP-2014]